MSPDAQDQIAGTSKAQRPVTELTALEFQSLMTLAVRNGVLLQGQTMKWEYQIYSHKQPSGFLFRGAGDLPAEEMLGALNKLGQEGWEVVSAFPVAMAQGATNMLGILLKRPLA
jgi:hypothetical protein